jgi:hypothetical protein
MIPHDFTSEEEMMIEGSPNMMAGMGRAFAKKIKKIKKKKLRLY